VSDVGISDHGELVFNVLNVDSIGLVAYGYAVKGYIYDGVFYQDAFLDLEDVLADGVTDINILVVMNEMDGVIKGMVKWRDGRPVTGGIIVEARNLEGVLIDTTRAENGMFTLRGPMNGTYVISVVHPYYTADNYTVEELPEEYPILIEFVLVPTDGSTYLFGFDLTHSLMVLGGIIGLFMMIFVVSYRIHIGRNPDSSKIHSEFKKKDQQ
jgi:hypothetical protein